MKILSQFDNSEVGNDCYHYSLWQYVNVFERLVFIHWTKNTIEYELKSVVRDHNKMREDGFEEIVKKLMNNIQ